MVHFVYICICWTLHASAHFEHKKLTHRLLALPTDASIYSYTYSYIYSGRVACAWSVVEHEQRALLNVYFHERVRVFVQYVCDQSSFAFDISIIRRFSNCYSCGCRWAMRSNGKLYLHSLGQTENREQHSLLSIFLFNLFAFEFTHWFSFNSTKQKINLTVS